MTSPAEFRIRAPQKPDPPAPYAFPVIASIAPVIVSVAMWLVTQSPFALMFAALGPVVAIASLADARIQGQKTSRREKTRFDTELELARQEVADAHLIERSARDEAAPSGHAIVERSTVDNVRWAGDAGSISVSLGRGTASSAVSIEGVEQSRSSSEDEIALWDLSKQASTLEDAPIVADARLGIGFCGPRTVAQAAARGVLVQLARSLSPAGYWWAASESAADGGERGWLDALPHPRGGALPGRLLAIGFGAVGSVEPIATVAISRDRDELPVGHRVVVRVGPGGSSIVAHPEPGARGEIRVELVSIEQAHAWADATREVAARDGLVADAGGIPDSVPLATLLGATGDGLECTPVVGAAGPVAIDLVSDGPHAIVGGSTGSGKSEFLLSWVLAMAAAHSPAEVTFLLVDFKGGSAFAPIAGLPHVVGLLTDLDEATAERALESLRAELRHRERELAAANARSVESTRLPRLVVVVDELAAMMNDFPELHALFSDIASRGRSLGVHLILCTQRPAAVARDGVLANADLRVSLRVNNRGDSVAVVGTDAAAALSAGESGRAVLSLGGQSTLVQAALAAPEDAELVAGRWPGPWRPRRPWCEPLPARLPIASLPAGAFGLLDLPGEQRQEPARYDPVAHGHVLVLGAAGSGKSTALSALAASSGDARSVPREAGGAWDAVVAAEPEPGRLLVVDDLDSLLTRFGEEHRAAFLERLARLLRDGPGRGIRLLVSAQRVTGEVQQLAGLLPSRLLLAQPSKQEHVLAGGDPARFRPRARPGFGDWLGLDVQVAEGATSPAAAELERVRLLEGGRPLAVVSTRPAAVADRLRGAYTVVELAGNPSDPRNLVVSSGTPTALVGDPEEWQSRWGAIGAIRSSTDVVFDNCSIVEFRAVTRSRELPPPLAPGSDACWLLTEAGTVSRVQLPPLAPQPV